MWPRFATVGPARKSITRRCWCRRLTRRQSDTESSSRNSSAEPVAGVDRSVLVAILRHEETGVVPPTEPAKAHLSPVPDVADGAQVAAPSEHVNEVREDV